MKTKIQFTWPFLLAFVFAFRLSPFAFGNTTAAPPATQPLRQGNGFLIGVFSQPIASFKGWVNDGVNTFVQWETSNLPESWWAGTATEAGASTIRMPCAQPGGGVTEAQWESWDATYAPPAGGIAWALPDEPDGNGITPAQLTAMATADKQVLHGTATLPVWLNVRGGSINGMQAPPSPIGQYLATADWLAEDFYPITGWGQPNLLLANGQILDQLRKLAPGKPVMCFIECSNQQLSWVANDTCVTPGQMRAEIWDAVIHGAYGIVYFPQQIGNGFSFDARPPAIVAEMVADDAMLKNLLFESGTAVTATAPFEACLRNYGGKPTYIVLNTSAAAANLPSGQSVAAYTPVFLAANPFPSTPSTGSGQAGSGQAPPTPAANPAVASATSVVVTFSNGRSTTIVPEQKTVTIKSVTIKRSDGSASTTSY